MDAAPLLSRRRVLGLLVVGEVLVVTCLGALAWHLWQESQAPAARPVQASPILNGGSPPPSPPAALPTVPPPSATATPSLRTDPAFLQAQARTIDREEAALEQVEWRIAHAVMDGAPSYLRDVVLPAVSRAQRQGAAR
jgi:hypothetical protein